jgi:hypothetical protein
MEPSVLIVLAVAYAAAYVWMGFALRAVLRKTGAQGDIAWVPIRRYVEAAKVGDVPMTLVWVARGIALVGWAVFFSFAGLRAWDVVAPSQGLSTLASTMFALALLSSAVAWVAWIVSANRIELRLVAQRRLAWVAAVLPPLWASLVGFGSARPAVVGPVRGADAASPPVDDDATRAIERVTAPAVQEVEPADADPEAAEAVEEAMTTDEEDITGKFRRAYSPYDTSTAQSADAAQVQPVEMPPWAYDDDDATFFAKRRRARWALQVVGGEEYDLEDVTTIGREGIRPIPGVLPIVDDTRTVSKLHARLRRESDNWFITDLGSTNGTFVRDVAGNEFEVKAQTEAKVQGTLLLGDLELVIVDLRGES